MDRSGKKREEPGRGTPGRNGSERARRISLRSSLLCLAGRHVAGKKPEQFLLQFRELHRGHRLPRIQHDVPPGGNGQPVEAKNFPYPAFHPIPKHCPAQLGGCSNSQAGHRQAVRTVKNYAEGRATTLPRLIDLPKFTSAQQPVLFGESLRPQANSYGVSR